MVIFLSVLVLQEISGKILIQILGAVWMWKVCLGTNVNAAGDETHCCICNTCKMFATLLLMRLAVGKISEIIIILDETRDIFFPL